jgi:selenocysteine lyase/cysteine desulfurase
MSAVALDVAAVRARFSALRRPTAFFDGPGGTQVPDSVIEAMASYLRESNANLGAPFERSRRSDALVLAAHEAAARFLGCSPDEVGFGQNMTTLNFALTRAIGRELHAGDEIVVTRLDHDGNV